MQSSLININPTEVLHHRRKKPLYGKYLGSFVTAHLRRWPHRKSLSHVRLRGVCHCLLVGI